MVEILLVSRPDPPPRLGVLVESGRGEHDEAGDGHHRAKHVEELDGGDLNAERSTVQRSVPGDDHDCRSFRRSNVASSYAPNDIARPAFTAFPQQEGAPVAGTD
jgi:hypothetical protein